MTFFAQCFGIVPASRRRTKPVKLSLKSIEYESPRVDQELAVTYVASSQELGELELKIVTSMPPDLNAAEQDAHNRIAAFAGAFLLQPKSVPYGTKIFEASGMTKFSAYPVHS